jgi:hypothetical protein
MKKICITLLLITSVIHHNFAQTKTYATSGLEMIMSWADMTDNTQSVNSNFRFAPVINIQSFFNVDFNEHFGLFTGLAVRNVGYIYGNYTLTTTNAASVTTTKTLEKRFRSYNIGIPIGFKLGNLNKAFIYAGYELEIPFLYKEKTYDGGDKTDKITGWFSNRQQSFYNSVLVGVQFPYGLNVKFKYYLTEFHNEGFTAADGSKPYAGLKSNVFTIALSALIFKDTELNTPQKN